MSDKRGCKTCKHNGPSVCDVVECRGLDKWKSLSKVDDSNDSHNNGGATDYYDLPDDVRECQSIIEWRKMNHAQGNIFKAGFCFNTGRHDGTTYERELNKIIYYAKRELTRIQKEAVC